MIGVINPLSLLPFRLSLRLAGEAFGLDLGGVGRVGEGDGGMGNALVNVGVGGLLSAVALTVPRAAGEAGGRFDREA